MATKKISELDPAAELTGTEILELLQGGANVRATAQDIADLGGGGGGAVGVRDAGMPIVPAATALNFTGAGVTVTDGGDGVANIDVPGGGGGGGGGGGLPWWFAAPLASELTLGSGDATQLTVADDPSVGFLADGGAPRGGDYFRWAYKTIPAPNADWSVTTRIEPMVADGSFSSIGMAIRNPANGRLLAIVLTNSGLLGVIRYASLAGAYVSNIATDYSATAVRHVKWFRIRYVHAELRYYFDFSVDGRLWEPHASDLVATYLTGQAAQVGLAVIYNRASGKNNRFSCDHWSQSW